MNVNSGDIIKYRFPEPKEEGMKEIIGRVEIVSDNNVKLKISFKNFNYITPVSVLTFSDL